jgi:hypothetical protein
MDLRFPAFEGEQGDVMWSYEEFISDRHDDGTTETSGGIGGQENPVEGQPDATTETPVEGRPQV